MLPNMCIQFTKIRGMNYSYIIVLPIRKDKRKLILRHYIGNSKLPNNILAVDRMAVSFEPR